MINHRKLQKYIEAHREALRFCLKVEDAIKKLETDEFADFGCMETAAAKRSSMDLTRALAKLRGA